MKTSKITIDTREALNRLAHPTFFNHEERRDAFQIVMRDGNALQKQSANQALALWPIDGVKASV